jgi:hypothetical protein
MSALPSRNLYYMSPLCNAGAIANIGVFSHNKAARLGELGIAARSFANPSVNALRSHIPVGPCGRSLHDFVPLYWATHTPMQYIVTQGGRPELNKELVFFLFDAEELLGLPGIWTTDGNAAHGESNRYESAGAVQHLDDGILNTPDCYSPEFKRKKHAEVLVPDWIPPSYLQRAAVSCEETRTVLGEQILERARELSTPPMVGQLRALTDCGDFDPCPFISRYLIDVRPEWY